MRNDFTLYGRKVPSGKRVYYYYTYDEYGNRRGPWTTGLTSKTAARNYCHSLLKKGALIKDTKSTSLFKDYAADFWDWDKSTYLKERKKRVNLTQNYTDNSQRITDRLLTPFFGHMKLNAISSDVIEKWIDTMIASGIKNVTINGYLGTLMTMIKWAVRKRLIDRDPFLDVDKLVKEEKTKVIVTRDEFYTMFVADWKKVWDRDLLMCTAHKLAALTGIRCCEVLGLKGEFVFDKHLYLNGQYDDYGYRATKTKKKHQIPLPASLVKDLKKLIKVNAKGFVFSENGGEEPITRRRLYLGLHRAFENIGIDGDEMKKRGLNIHAWRHFCTTELMKGGMSVKKVQAVTGHKTETMTDNYTHFNPMDFHEVSKIQEMLLKPKKRRKRSNKLR